MPLTNAYRDFLAMATVGDAVTPFNNANARIGVGASNAAFAATQTDLAHASDKLRKAMDGGFPTRTANVLQFRATFGTTEANFAWQEWGVFNAGPAGGVMLNRKVEALGTKTGAQTWQITVDVTLTV